MCVVFCWQVYCFYYCSRDTCTCNGGCRGILVYFVIRVVVVRRILNIVWLAMLSVLEENEMR